MTQATASFLSTQLLQLTLLFLFGYLCWQKQFRRHLAVFLCLGCFLAAAGCFVTDLQTKYVDQKEQKRIEAIPEGAQIQFQDVDAWTFPDTPDPLLSDHPHAIAAWVLTTVRTDPDGPVQQTFPKTAWEDVTAASNSLCAQLSIDTVFQTVTATNPDGILQPDTSANIAMTIVIDPQQIRKDTKTALQVRRLAGDALSQAGITETMTEKEAVLAILSWVCDHMTYDDAGGDAITGFTEGTGNCNTYALLIRAMCKEAGIRCTYQPGEADNGTGFGPHAWNQIWIDETPYWLDAGWVDDGNLTYCLSKTLWPAHRIT